MATGGDDGPYGIRKEATRLRTEEKKQTANTPYGFLIYDTKQFGFAVVVYNSGGDDAIMLPSRLIVTMFWRDSKNKYAP